MATFVLRATGASMSEGVATLSEAFDAGGAEALLRAALDSHGERFVVASSFGVEDVVLIDLLARAERPFRVVTLDTGRLPEETQETIERIRERYGLTVEVFFPRTEDVETLVRLQGPRAFYGSLEARVECCRVRKVEPLRRALDGARAWATGMRRAQGETRAELRAVALDEAGRIKLAPLCHWSDDEVWAHVRAHGVPYNRLHDRGYPSIGCAPCTRAVAPGEPARSGRWWWESPDHKECGLHHRFAWAKAEEGSR